jgi:hypothetical protein
MEQVQKQREELIQSLDFSKELRNQKVPKKDHTGIRQNVKPAPYANIPKPSLSDLHDKEQHRQFTFDPTDFGIGKMTQEDGNVGLHTEVVEKTVPQETLVGATNVVPNECTPIIPLAKDTVPALGPLFTFSQNEPDSLHHTNRDIIIKSLVELVDVMHDTIDRQDALISSLTADNDSFRPVTTKRNDSYLPRTETAAIGHIVGNDAPHHSSSVKRESSSNEDVSSVINRHWQRLETLRRKHGWQ